MGVSEDYNGICDQLDIIWVRVCVCVCVLCRTPQITIVYSDNAPVDSAIIFYCDISGGLNPTS